MRFQGFFAPYYTIPRPKRELQQIPNVPVPTLYYTIPRPKRELQQELSTKRLKKIIPYQDLKGNYNIKNVNNNEVDIIPYQDLKGNYNYVIQFIKRG